MYMGIKNICTEVLSVHIAISCGELCFGILGGWGNQWEFLISGECMFELSKCLDEAPSKQIVVKDSISMKNTEKIKFEETESGNFLTTIYSVNIQKPTIAAMPAKGMPISPALSLSRRSFSRSIDINSGSKFSISDIHTYHNGITTSSSGDFICIELLN